MPRQRREYKLYNKDVENTFTQHQTQIQQLDSSISLQASTITNLNGKVEEYYSELTVADEGISTEVAKKVGKDAIISSINQSAEAVTINASKVNLNGYVTMTNLSTSGQTTIDGGNITTGTISASRLDLSGYATFSDLSTAGATTISGSNISTGTISAVNGNSSFNLNTGALTIGAGSILLGTESTTTNFFKVTSGGNLSWRQTYSSMSSTGTLSCTGADITGTIKTVDGTYTTKLANGWIYFLESNSNIGKIGAAAMSDGDAFNLNMMSGASSFGIYDGDGNYATGLLTYTKNTRTWNHEGSKFYWNSNGTAYMYLTNSSLYVPVGYVYSHGYKCLTVDDGISYTFGVEGLDGGIWDLKFVNGVLTSVTRR